MTSEDFSNSVIPARNRRQAMDWSLVLLSQGIECVIERSADGWTLLVEPQDRSRALATLRQYQIENRGWAWRQPLPWPEVAFNWSAIMWCLLLALFHWLNAASGSYLQQVGLMDPSAVQSGAWWRLFTAVWLHFDLTHLMANLVVGFPVFGLAMGRYGPACAWLAGFLTGAGGNVAGLLLHQHAYHGLGASGMVMGGLGLLTIQSLSIRFKNPRSGRYITAGILAGVLLFTLLGLNPTSDVIAHLGGFLCGLSVGTAMTLIPQKTLLGRPANVVCGAVLAGLIALTWERALRHLPLQ